MASKLDPLRCCSGKSLPTPPPDYDYETGTPFFVYHCDSGHITCTNCLPSPSADDKVESPKSFPCSKCPLLMHSCRMTSILISRMLLECVHRVAGCMISLDVSNYDAHSCGHADYPCLFCTVSCTSVANLSAHLDECHPTIKREPIVPDKEREFQISLEEKILLQDKQGLLVLRFEKGYLFLQVWDKHRRHLLHFYPNDGGDDYMRYDGITSRVKVKTVTPILESVKVPFAFDQDKPVTCGVEIEALEEGNEAMARVIGLTAAHLKDMECQVCLKRIQPPIIHCVYDHPLCLECLGDVVNRRIGKGGCLACGQGIVGCDLGDYILRNSHFPCLESRCDRLDLKYAATTEHEIECRKPLSCPLCLTLSFTTLEELKEHLGTVHDDETKGIKATQESEIIVSAGCNVVREVDGLRDYFVVIYEDGKLSVQHLEGTRARKYYVSVIVVNKGEILAWSQGALTTEVKKKPTLSDQYILLPSASASNEYVAAITLNINVPKSDEPEP